MYIRANGMLFFIVVFLISLHSTKIYILLSVVIFYNKNEKNFVIVFTLMNICCLLLYFTTKMRENFVIVLTLMNICAKIV